MNDDLEKVAAFYGLSEKELVRRHGGILEVNLQAFEDAMQDSILRKIADQPEHWNEIAQALAEAIEAPDEPAP